MDRVARVRQEPTTAGATRAATAESQRATPRGHSYRELSLPLDPDIIARYLAGQDITAQVREALRGKGAERESPNQPPPRPTIALIAVGVALAMFVCSIWVAFQ